jgi:Tfp pilus assembly protein PilX
MNQIDRSRPLSADRQAGTTLIVALVLILLASLLAVFAMNVGIFAQRTSAADLRARAVHQTLEAALSQGIEYVKNNRTIFDPTNAVWTQCTATDTSFPCGTVPKCIAGYEASTGCTGGTAFSRRANMFYYAISTGAGYNVDGTSSGASTTNQLYKNSLPLASSLRMSSVSNGFAVNYGVGVLMCVVKKPVLTTDPTECTQTTTNAAGTYLFTVTAVGNISTESAATTLSTTFGTSPIAPGAVGAPTIVASGSVDLTGSGTYVTDPSGAGPGVPVTVWSRECTKKTGTINTCYMEDFMRSVGSVNKNATYSFAANSTGSTSGVVKCSGSGTSCSCSTALSYQSSGNAAQAGIDILSNDSLAGNVTGGCTDPPVIGTTACTTGTTCKSNYNVNPTEFPCDLFQYVFGVSAWSDLSGTSNTDCVAKGMVDCFCETRKTTSWTDSYGVTHAGIGVDEAYLYTKAAIILPTSAHTGWVSASQLVADCATLISRTSSSTSKGGLVWDQTGACLASMGTSSQIGWPDKPVILVEDGANSSTGVKFTGGTLYGLVFVRDVASPMDFTAGGDGTFTASSNGTVYGSVVVQGTATKLNGNSAIIYNASVLGLLDTLSASNPAAPVPGSWTDRYSY